MVQVRITSLQRSESATPPHNLLNKPLSCRFVGGKLAQKFDQALCQEMLAILRRGGTVSNLRHNGDHDHPQAGRHTLSSPALGIIILS